MKVLTLNAGSRSHSARLYEVGERPPLDPPEPLWHAEIEAGPETFDDLIAHYRGAAPDLAGHRVVHPGPTLATRTAAIFDADVRAAIEAAIPLAPSHEPLALGQLRSRGDLLSARPGHAACRVRAGTK